MASERFQSIVYGTLGGLTGAGCMTFVRTAGRRAGLVEITVPQAMEETLAEKANVSLPGGPLPHHLFDQLLHLGYGAFQGAVYGALRPAGRGASLRSGLLFGVTSWAAGSGLLVPLSGAGDPLWRRRPLAAGLDLFAHLLFGATVALLEEQMQRESSHRPQRHAARGRASRLA